jgi:hypothetical protein
MTHNPCYSVILLILSDIELSDGESQEVETHVTVTFSVVVFWLMGSPPSGRHACRLLGEQ